MRAAFVLLIGLSTALFFSCTAGTTGPTGSGSGDDDATPTATATPAFAATEGHWLWGTYTFNQNDCNVDPDDVAAVGFTLANGADGAFTVADDEPNREVLNCTYDDMDFSCADSTVLTDLSDQGLNDAVLTSVQTTTGSFIDETMVNSNAAFVVTCDGDDCVWAELAQNITFPCIINVDVDATFEQ